MPPRLILASTLLLTAWSKPRSHATSAPSTAPTNACGDSAEISWQPARPRQGALLRVRMSRVTRGTSLSGELAGEPLHFSVSGADSSRAESFAAVPIDSDSSLRIEIRCVAGDRTDSLVTQLRASRAAYPVERLKVAPDFGKPPDSALAVRIDRESKQAAEVARQSHETPRLWRRPFMLPRASRITSGFGRGREFNGTITSRHMGTDFAGTTGAPVRAANRGVVRIVDSFYYGGNVVYVDHGEGLTSAYLHLSKQSVAPGDTVERGQILGRVGATGRVTGPHLHLIARYGAITVDPMSLFALAGEPKRGRQ